MTSWLPLLLLLSSCASTSGAPPTDPMGSSKLADESHPEGGPKEFEVPIEQLGWEELSPEVFDRKWVLPEPRTTTGRDLLVEMRSLLDLRFDIESAEGSNYRCLGDLLVAARELEPRARQAWFAELERKDPKLMADWGGGLTQLLFDSHLHSTSWSPSEDHANDGLLCAETWNMKAEGAPWDAVGVRPLMEQSAALLYADLATIKAVENDYRAYPKNVGADYEEIFPIAGTYFIGTDSADRPFSTLTIRFRCDLPFPFSSYTTRLGILNQFDDANVLYTHIYSTSEDFYWLAGRDVFLPVTTSNGDWVAFLLVRHFGFDLDGVPDDSDNRREALRGSMGNLKRNSERLYREQQEASRAPRNTPEILGRVRVLGCD
jgi:hypothetical protein